VSKYLIADPPPAPPGDGPPRRRRSEPPPGGGPPHARWKSVLPYVLGGLLIVLGAFFALVAVRIVRDHDTFGNALIKQIVAERPPRELFGKERIYVLLLGIDYNYDDKGMPYSKGARSDTIMAAGLDFPSKSMKLVSVLRDTEALVNGHDTKINEAYSDGGEKLSDKVIGDFLGMPLNEHNTHFDRYVIVKINAIKDFVNAIGGVDVPVTENMDYDDNWGHLHIHFKANKLYHMSGEDAQGYMRFRHDACSDPCRTKRQQQVMQILIHKLKGDRFNDIAHLPQLLNVFNKDVITNLTFDEEKSLALAFKDANTADLSHADTIGYVDTKDTSYGGQVLIPDEKQRVKLVSELLGAYGNVTPPPRTALQSVKPSTVHVQVQNGSGIAGLATTVSAKLTKLGYVVDSVGNADTFGYDTTQIRPASKAPYVGERVRADLGVPGAVIAPATDATPGPRSVVTLIVGRDYAVATASAVPTSSVAPVH
jgi:polyisoprenyl-teichoic acid--peptidoglycan teichoic acid transferase